MVLYNLVIGDNSATWVDNAKFAITWVDSTKT